MGAVEAVPLGRESRFVPTSPGRQPKGRRYIVSIATSADGFIARRDGSFDWLDRPRPKGNGIALFVMARRNDEPNPKYDVK